MAEPGLVSRQAGPKSHELYPFAGCLSSLSHATIPHVYLRPAQIVWPWRRMNAVKGFRSSQKEIYWRRVALSAGPSMELLCPEIS